MANEFGPFYHRNKATGKTADDLQIIVDVSNDTDYPHQGTSASVVLDRLRFRVKETANDGNAGKATLQIGVVEENDATNGTMAIIAESTIIGAGDEHESDWLFFGGIDLRVVSGVLTLANAPVSGDLTLLQNDQGNLVDAERNTNKSVGVGDLVVFLDETTDGGTYEYEVQAIWRAS
jgi:hypothetical protein